MRSIAGPLTRWSVFGLDAEHQTEGAEPVDLVTVVELIGHADINTACRYTLPSEADKAASLEALTVDR